MKVILYDTKSNTATLYQFIIGLFSDEHLISHYNRAVARFVKLGGGGIIMSAKGTSLVGGGGLGTSSSKKFSNLEALKRHILSQDSTCY